MDIVTLALAKKYSKDLYEKLSNLGRFLSVWDATTGKPKTEPGTIPYTYKTGDYYVVDTVGQVNYKPNGNVYDGKASTQTESGQLNILDMYYFDSKAWVLVSSSSILNTKLDIMPGDEYTAGNAYNLPYFFETSADDKKAVVTAKTVTLDGNKTHGEYTLQVKSATEDVAGLMSAQDKKDLADKVDKPIEPVAGQGVNVPYFFEVSYGTNKVTVKDHTVDLLDKSKAPKTYTLDINCATNEKAGLMSKDDKAKLDTALQEHQSLADYRTSAAQDIIDATKQDVLTAGDNITIDSNNKISANASSVVVTGESGHLDKDKVLLLDSQLNYIERNNIKFSRSSIVSGRSSLVATYVSTVGDNSDIILVNIDLSKMEADWQYVHNSLQNKLSAGDNITITDDNVISATGTLPSESSASEIMVSNGTSWQRQGGYGYDVDTPDIYEWDGDASGKQTVSTDYGYGVMCNIANPSELPTYEKIINHKYTYYNNGEQTTQYWSEDNLWESSNHDIVYGSCISDKLYMIVVYNDDTLVEFFGPGKRFDKGIWFGNNSGDYVSSIESANLTTTKIDSRFIPKQVLPFPEAFVNNTTLNDFVDSINNYSGKEEGLVFWGQVKDGCSPWGSGNADCKVEYIKDIFPDSISAIVTAYSASNNSDTFPNMWTYHTLQNVSEGESRLWRAVVTMSNQDAKIFQIVQGVPLPSDLSKTHTLKLVNGKLSFVEDV